MRSFTCLPGNQLSFVITFARLFSFKKGTKCTHEKRLDKERSINCSALSLGVILLWSHCKPAFINIICHPFFKRILKRTVHIMDTIQRFALFTKVTGSRFFQLLTVPKVPVPQPLPSLVPCSSTLDTVILYIPWNTLGWKWCLDVSSPYPGWKQGKLQHYTKLLGVFLSNFENV